MWVSNAFGLFLPSRVHHSHCDGDTSQEALPVTWVSRELGACTLGASLPAALHTPDLRPHHVSRVGHIAGIATASQTGKHDEQRVGTLASNQNVKHRDGANGAILTKSPARTSQSSWCMPQQLALANPWSSSARHFSRPPLSTCRPHPHPPSRVENRGHLLWGRKLAGAASVRICGAFSSSLRTGIWSRYVQGTHGQRNQCRVVNVSRWSSLELRVKSTTGRTALGIGLQACAQSHTAIRVHVNRALHTAHKPTPRTYKVPGGSHLVKLMPAHECGARCTSISGWARGRRWPLAEDLHKSAALGIVSECRPETTSVKLHVCLWRLWRLGQDAKDN
ncbi:hypothetical protein B0H10DRAFT_1952005 [Mycena sp. CBHHK59/15]|nr:hypothetical protein B0H10DRAFT_1952005 [Mycena sp. CBHHK59/15]